MNASARAPPNVQASNVPDALATNKPPPTITPDTNVQSQYSGPGCPRRINRPPKAQICVRIPQGHFSAMDRSRQHTDYQWLTMGRGRVASTAAGLKPTVSGSGASAKALTACK